MSQYRTPIDTEKIASTTFMDQPDVEVSTIGIFRVGGVESDEPYVYETMIFAKEYPDIHHDEWRTPTRDEAMKTHKDIVEFVAGYLAGKAHTKGDENS